jgi:hypothetical protein
MTRFAADWGFAMAYDADIYRAATVVIERYGSSAPLWAFKRVDEFQANEDSDGVALWRAILGAIQELQRRRPKRPRAG